MKNRLGKIIHGMKAGQAGQAMVLILIFFLLGSLTITPVLMHMATALKTETKYESKTYELFTADAGIETGLWRIKYDFMGPDYDPYDFETVWPYETDEVNGLSADVLVQNVWLPSNVTLDELGLDAEEARAIIESEKLVISGTSGAVPGQPFHIKLEFTPEPGDNLTIKSIGVWLPQGFTYTVGDSELEQLNAFDPCHPDDVDIETVPGGTAIVWSYDAPYPLFIDFPNYTVEEGKMTFTFEFTYAPPADDPDKMPLGVAWVTTEMDPSCINTNDVPIAWDTDMRYYKITSTSSNTDIETYSSKSQLRNLGNAIAGDYVAIGNSMMSDSNSDNIRDTWNTPSEYTLTKIPEDADVIAAYLYWSGWRNDTRKITSFSDTCTALTNWDYSSPTVWNVVASSYFNGHHSTGGSSARLLTLKNSCDLSSFVPGTTMVTWKHSTPPAFSDSCSSFGSIWVDGGDWATSNGAFRARSTAPPDDPVRILTLAISVDLSYSSFENITISWNQKEDNSMGSGDGLDFAISTDGGTSWQSNIVAFRDDIGSNWLTYSYSLSVSELSSNFKVRFQVVGNSSAYCYIDNIAITPVYTSLDGLDIAISADGGNTWSSNEEIFRGDIGSTQITYDYYLPTDYSTSTSFKVRFQLVGMGGPGKSVTLDDIKIINLPPDTSISFFINGQQVYLDASNNPQIGAQPLSSSRSYAKANYLSGGTLGFSYASVRDVSRLVKKYPVVAGEQHHTGNAKYTVDSVSADTGSHFAFAGWSLIIIYGSPTTAGHYLYLWDENFAYHPGTGQNLDWDDNGEPGGDITGFLFPEPIRDKYGTVIDNVSARLTCFVVEGDRVWTPDSVGVVGQQSLVSKILSNSLSPSNNAWDGLWPHEGTVYEGVDIDTYEILWTDNIFTPKDTRLTINLNSSQDSYNLVYLILSVRSETVTSGTGHYTISAN